MDPGAGPQPLTLPAPEGYGPWLDASSDAALSAAREGVAALRAGGHSGADALAAYHEVTIALVEVLAVVSLLSNVHPDAAVRTRAEEIEKEAHRLLTDIGLDRGVHDALARVDPHALDPGAHRFLDRALRDFRRAGVDRDEETRERLRSLAERQTEVGQRFSRTIRDGVVRFTVAADRLAGLPEDFVASREPDAAGAVELSTDYPDYVPVMTFATDRALREQMLRAFLTRAWPENDATLRELLQVRRDTAVLLGWPDWPSYDAEVKMIGSGEAIGAFIDRISGLAAGPARRDFDILLARLRDDLPDATEVTSIDKSFYAEVVRRERFEVDAQQVRAYFAFEQVREGLLEVTGRLFGLDYVEVPGAPVWHPDVTVYDVLDQVSGERLGRIYLDLHPRPGKYSHAAQFTLADGLLGRRLPEGVLVCNFPHGLMEHDQVVTLFHEFGHLVHHVLGGRQQWARFSGVATEWDFVEAPSQLLEEWAWDHAVLATFAHDADGHPIPADLVARMRKADEFGKGFAARTQMFYAALSLVFHRDVPDDLTGTLQRLQESYDLFAFLPGTHFHASFGHLVGYSSGYYTYMWSLVIAKDLFSAFHREDLFDREVARRYRQEILEPGGARDAAESVEAFLGRPTSFEAFLDWLAAG